jgi:hypothetical protein
MERKNSQVIDRQCHIRVLGSKGSALNVQCLANQLLCLGVSARTHESVAQVLHRLQGFPVIRSKDPALNIQRFAFQFLRFGVSAQGIEGAC